MASFHSIVREREASGFLPPGSFYRKPPLMAPFSSYDATSWELALFHSQGRCIYFPGVQLLPGNQRALESRKTRSLSFNPLSRCKGPPNHLLKVILFKGKVLMTKNVVTQQYERDTYIENVSTCHFDSTIVKQSFLS